MKNWDPLKRIFVLGLAGVLLMAGQESGPRVTVAPRVSTRPNRSGNIRVDVKEVLIPALRHG